MKNLRIGVRLSAAFGLLIMLLVGISAVALMHLDAESGRMKIMVDENVLKAEYAHQIKDNGNYGARQIRNALLASSPDEAARYLQRIRDNRAKNQAVMEKLDAHIHSVEGRHRFEEMKAAQSRYVATRAKVINLIEQGQKDPARDLLFGDVRKEQDAYFAAIENLVTFEVDVMNQSGAEAVHAANRAVWTIGLLAFAATGFAAFCGWSITRSVTAPARAAVDSAVRVAHGDLTGHIEAQTGDEMGLLMRALQTMNVSLVRIIGGVRTSVETISSAAEQIASENAALASRTEEQAASLEQTAASMTQLTETVKRNAESAYQAKALATGASGIADSGHAAVQEMLETIGQVNDSADKISDITGVIEGIAFQTNILALNAAVEAARAGEQGRGFAVVASEVRSLAQRSAAAAKEIKALIETSVGMIQQSSHQAGEVGETVDRINEAVRQVSAIVSEISVASEQQTTGIEQVHAAVGQIDHVTQENAALVEEAAAASKALEEQAHALHSAIAFFKIDAHKLPRLAA
ncbi:methyl-accepting chemotaxis protein [Trinickia sp.]|uniref:methyl-accepting chemotaxis protein n=1 Tax=Trinickia sp. TaxID=2571163 RepID=UPI003F7CE026